MRYAVPNAPSSQADHGGPKCEGRQKQNPRRFLTGGPGRQCWINLPVALGAEQQNERVLILQLVGRGGLGRSGKDCTTRVLSRRQRDVAVVLLVEMGPSQIGREGQVLHRSPAGDDTRLGDVEVRVTSVRGRSCPDTRSGRREE